MQLKQVATDLFGEPIVQDVLLRDKFLEPPFSVLDTKGGAWQNRKRQWKAKGIKSELGRDVESMPSSFGGELDENGLDKYGRKPMSGTSIFDPALTELMYHWFCPDGGRILDPFAGGSVRGIVANYLGYKYTGIDIRQEQIDSNREQALDIVPNNLPRWYVGDSNVILQDFINDLTPVQKHGKYWVKRDDYFCVAGVNGGKVRSCYNLMRNAKGAVTAGSRKSPQINIVASIAKHLGIPFYAHCPEGELGDELLFAKEKGANIVQHKAGYNSVIKARAKEHAAELGYLEVPFGMMCDTAVEETKKQVQNIPKDVKRIVIPVGSGMSLAGLLTGMQELGLEIPVFGVVVGAEPEDTLNAFAPMGWRNMVTLVPSGMDYHKEAPNDFNGILLDPIYEAKCIPFLEEGDLLWIVGLRESVARVAAQNDVNNKDFDFIFSCPPYADLEVYSDLEGDISNKDYNEFIRLYGEIINKSCQLLKKGGMACFVVGDVRDKKGYYRNFVSDTVECFLNSGMKLYNHAILLQPLGTAMLRAGKIFDAGMKLTKVHEDVLLFIKP